MRWLLILMVMINFSALGQENRNPYLLDVDVTRVGKTFKLQATYSLPITKCATYAYLTNYEGATSIPSILESKIIYRSGNKARVERLIQERILWVPINMRSVVEFSEIPNQGVDFEQISGDSKLYKGSWRLSGEGGITHLKYQSIIEPNSLIPNFVIEYFLENSLYQYFEKVAENARQYGQKQTLACN